MSMRRTITVKGSGQATVKPDCIRITLDLAAHDADYSNALEQATAQTDGLYEALRKAEFSPKTVHTTDFSIHPDVESFQVDGVWKQRTIGYCCTHRLVFEFPLDRERMICALYALSTCDALPECGIAFCLRDPRAAEELLLRDAAANAHERAEILANASGCELGELLTIDYHVGKFDGISSTNFDTPHTLRMGKIPDLHPEELRLQEDVTFTWELI